MVGSEVVEVVEVGVSVVVLLTADVVGVETLAVVVDVGEALLEEGEEEAVTGRAEDDPSSPKQDLSPSSLIEHVSPCATQQEFSQN